MNALFKFIACLGALLIVPFAAAEDINGTWRFDYGYDMTFIGSGGSFTGSGSGNGTPGLSLTALFLEAQYRGTKATTR